MNKIHYRIKHCGKASGETGFVTANSYTLAFEKVLAKENVKLLDGIFIHKEAPCEVFLYVNVGVDWNQEAPDTTETYFQILLLSPLRRNVFRGSLKAYGLSDAIKQAIKENKIEQHSLGFEKNKHSINLLIAPKPS